MGHHLTQSDLEALGGLGFMTVLIDWHKLPLVVHTGYWREAKDDLACRAEEIAVGRIFTTLDREDELTDETCFINIRCEDKADFERLKAHFGTEPIRFELPDEDD